MRTATVGFMVGLSVPLKGLELIFASSRLRRAALIPFVLTLLIFIFGVFFGLPSLAHLIPMLTGQGLAFLGLATGTISYTMIYWLVFLLSWPAAIFSLFYILFLASRLIAAPFYALLAERVLIERRLIEDRPFQFADWLNSNAKLLGTSLLKVGVFLIVGLILFFLSFLPGLGLFTGFGFLLMAAFDVMDMSFEAMRMDFGARARFFRLGLPCFFGLATAMGLVFLIPGLNFFLFPASVAGASEIIRHETMNGRLV